MEPSNSIAIYFRVSVRIPLTSFWTSSKFGAVNGTNRLELIEIMEAITMASETIQLPDGYNGHTVTCFAKPIYEGKSIVWLRVAEPGKEYMKRWAHRETWHQALDAQQVNYVPDSAVQS